MTFFLYDRYNPIYINFIVAFIQLLLLAYVIHTLFNREFQKEETSKIHPISNKDLVATSFPMFITASIMFFVSQMDILMIGALLTETDVGIYSIVSKIAMLTSFILTSINSIAAPKFSELFHAEKMEDLEEIAKKSTKLMFFASLPFLLSFIFFSEFFLSFFGTEFIVGASALIILSIGQFFNTISGSIGYFLNMTGHQGAYKNIMIAGMLLNAVLNYILIPRYGINGAAIATTISIVFWNSVSTLYAYRKFRFTLIYLPFISPQKTQKAPHA